MQVYHTTIEREQAFQAYAVKCLPSWGSAYTTAVIAESMRKVAILASGREIVTDRFGAIQNGRTNG